MGRFEGYAFGWSEEKLQGWRQKGLNGKRQWSDDKILPVDDEGMIIATWNDGCKKDMGITLEEYNAQAERHKEKRQRKRK